MFTLSFCPGALKMVAWWRQWFGGSTILVTEELRDFQVQTQQSLSYNYVYYNK